jgi:hypothetical protein
LEQGFVQVSTSPVVLQEVIPVEVVHLAFVVVLEIEMAVVSPASHPASLAREFALRRIVRHHYSHRASNFLPQKHSLSLSPASHCPSLAREFAIRRSVHRHYSPWASNCLPQRHSSFLVQAAVHHTTQSVALPLEPLTHSVEAATPHDPDYSSPNEEPAYNTARPRGNSPEMMFEIESQD